MKKQNELKYEDNSGLYAAGMELPIGMTVKVCGNTVYFLSIDKRDFLTLSRKLQQVQLASRDEFYPEKEK